MFINYDPIVKTTIAFLKLLKVKVNDVTVNETLQSHPDWPSLLCIKDALDKWKVPNIALKIDPHELDTLPTPFIISGKSVDSRFSIVKNYEGNEVDILINNISKPIVMSKEKFIGEWNGLCLVAIPDTESGERNYEKVRRKYWMQKLQPITLISVILIFLFYSAFQQVKIPIIPVFLQLLVMIAGVTLSTLLLWFEIDRHNSFLQKFCTGIIRGNCSAILTSKQSKIFNWLSWSEIGFFYFAGGVLILFLSDFSQRGLAIIALLNLAALPYTLFSVYYQWRVVKQWCILCLLVQAILLIGGANVLINHLNNPLLSLSAGFLLRSFSLYLAVILLWYSIKPHIIHLQELKNTKREYLRTKFNTNTFEALLKRQKKINLPVEGLGITLGNPIALNKILKVCNPLCIPCSRVHAEIDALLDSNPNIQIQILFNSYDNSYDKAALPAKHLLSIFKDNDEEFTRQALHDWYSNEKKDFEEFSQKYPVGKQLSKQGEVMRQMRDWCDKMEIHVTPTFFFNGFQLPEIYTVSDLNYFLLA